MRYRLEKLIEGEWWTEGVYEAESKALMNAIVDVSKYADDFRLVEEDGNHERTA